MIELTYHILGCVFYAAGAVYYIAALYRLLSDRKRQE